MKKLIERDKKRRDLVALYEKKRLFLKGIVANNNLALSVRWKAGLELSDLPKNSSKTRVKNRCILTGRSRAVDKNFKISRVCLRELAGSGSIPGLRKSSW
jgi:small subunit ribosomal protein S14